METICYIFGAGEYGEITINPKSLDGNYIIAADGGYLYLKNKNIIPDLVVGDFDSLQYIPENLDIIKHPVMKDDTDMLLAVKEGFSRGFFKFVIYGGLGGRLDHTLANLQVLRFIAENNGIGFLIGEDTTITCIYNSTLSFINDYNGTVSVFCNSGAAYGVSINGLKYCLKNAELKSNMPIGVSNEFIDEQAKITVCNGSLIVMWEQNLDKELPKCLYNQQNKDCV